MRTRERFTIQDSLPAGAASRAGWTGSKGSRAFSLIELIIVMGLLSVMVLGLMAMFNQTQRAFRLGMSQTDVLEAGRITSGMLVHEIEQITPSYGNGNPPTLASPGFWSQLFSPGNTSVMPMLAGTIPRTNVMEDVFFLTRQNQTWTGIGYFVRTNDVFPGGFGFGAVGTLYRYETNNSISQFQGNPNGFITGFNNARDGSGRVRVSRVLEGIVHFRVKVYDRDGIWISTFNFSRPSITVTANNGEPFCQFRSNAVPAFVEVELGILEQQAYEHLRSIPVLTAQSNYLAGLASKVHLFRQRIAVRNVDPSAYP